MIVKKILLFIILFFLFLTTNSQNKGLDSLLKASKKEKDTILIKTLNKISWEYKNSNLDSALVFGRLALKKALHINHPKSISSAYNSIGSAYQAKSKTDSALFYHKKSLVLKREILDSVGIASSLNNLGIIEDEMGNYLEALQNYFEALSIFERKSKSFENVPMVLLNIGIVYKKQKKYDKVLEYYKRALTIYTENNFKIGVVITTGNIGGVLLKLDKNKEAIAYCESARKMYSDLGYTRYIPYMDVNIAAATYNLKEYSKSINLYLNVIKKFKTDGNLYELSNAKIGISKPYTSIKQFNNAKEQLVEAFAISEENNYKEFEAEALKYLAEVNFKSNNFREAYLYQQKYNSKKDSIFETTKTKDINELLVKYETSKKEKEIILQKEQLLEKELAIKNRNLYALLLASALIILGIIFFSIYKRYQLKKKQLQKEIDLKDALSVIKTQNRLQEQRLRISRDLHDNIGSQLTFIISSLDNLKYVTRDANSTLKDKLVSISSFTSETIHQLRDTIWAMNKAEISIEDLHIRILSFVEKAKIATENLSFEINQNITLNTKLTSIKGMHVFRVIQEAINNAIKYADASKISINLSEKENIILISVIDNGIGFDIKSVELGNGLFNMEKRMSEIDGEITINSEIGNGTEIKITL